MTEPHGEYLVGAIVTDRHHVHAVRSVLDDRGWLKFGVRVTPYVEDEKDERGRVCFRA